MVQGFNWEIGFCRIIHSLIHLKPQKQKEGISALCKYTHTLRAQYTQEWQESQGMRKQNANKINV